MGCGRPGDEAQPQVHRSADVAVHSDDQARGLRGGEMTVSIRTEPRSFNVLLRRDAVTYLVGLLTQARLVRVNAATQQIEPMLTARFERLDKGRRYRLTHCGRG